MYSSDAVDPAVLRALHQGLVGMERARDAWSSREWAALRCGAVRARARGTRVLSLP